MVSNPGKKKFTTVDLLRSCNYHPTNQFSPVVGKQSSKVQFRQTVAASNKPMHDVSVRLMRPLQQVEMKNINIPFHYLIRCLLPSCNIDILAILGQIKGDNKRHINLWELLPAVIKVFSKINHRMKGIENVSMQPRAKEN